MRQFETGRSIGIFPEGALSPLARGPGFHRAHTGVVRLCAEYRGARHPGRVSLGSGANPLCRGKLPGINPRPRVGIPVDPYALTVGKAIHLDGEIDDRAFVRSTSQHVMQHIARLARQSDQRIRPSALNRVQAAAAGQRKAMERALAVAQGKGDPRRCNQTGLRLVWMMETSQTLA